jgi:RHS repeat-associated protein
VSLPASLPRIGALAASILAMLAIAPVSARAQSSPLIAFDPISKTVTASTQFVRVTLCGDSYGLDLYSLQIVLNGTTNVTGSFVESATPVWPSGYTQCVVRHQFEGTIGVSAQQNTLDVQVTNNSGSATGSGSVVYTRPVPKRDVTVMAAAQYVDVAPGALSTRPFVVTNPTSLADSFTVTGSCTGDQGCTFGSPSLSLGAGQSATIIVNYPASSTIGTVGLAKYVIRSKSDAAVADSGWAELTVRALPAQGAVLASTPDYLDASQCVRIGVPGASIMCGKLVTDHALPAMRTMNRTWQPRLVYSAATSVPMPNVQMDVSVEGGTPDSVTATLVAHGSVRARGAWAGSGWAGMRTRRISLSYVGLAFSTNAYAYTLEVKKWVGATATTLGTTSSRLVIVNRAASPFGGGWWLDGFEQLALVTDGTGDLLWVGGDGSHAIYARKSDSVWVAPKVTVPDTIVRAGTGYHRRIPGGGYVAFDASYRHVLTVNRNQQSTFFDHANGKLSAVRPPLPAGAASGLVRYEIAYSSGRVDYTAASDRNGVALRRVTTTWLDAGASSSITRITDPDGIATTFEVEPGYSHWITARWDRRGQRTFYGWTSNRDVQYVSGPALQGGGSWLANYLDARARGLVVGLGSGQFASVGLDSAYTRYDGPRTDVSDVTSFWVNALGAPVRVRNALGQETRLTYSSYWPGTVQEVRDASNSVSIAGLSRPDGLVGSTTTKSLRDDNIDATTTVGWNVTWRKPERITQHLGDFIQMQYDNAGNLLWQRPNGEVAREVSYTHSAGRVTSVKAPADGQGAGQATSTFTYDPVLGNLQTSTTPLGRTTTYEADGFGRDTLVVSPVKADTMSRQRTWFDDMGRAWRTVTRGPAMGGRPADSVVVRHVYDSTGNVRFTYRGFVSQGIWSELQHRWSYDSLGQVTEEVRDDGTFTSYQRDAAGNVTHVTGSRGLTTVTTYDALNRAVRRVAPSVSYPSESCQLPVYLTCYYTFPTRGSSVVIPADTSVYRFDNGGRMIRADNGYARVRRRYTRSGLLTNDDLTIRAVIASTEDQAGKLTFPEGWGSGGGGGGGCIGRNCDSEQLQGGGETAQSGLESPGVNDDFWRTYAIRYHYDLNSRRDSIYYPTQAPCVGSCLKRQGFSYSTTTGELQHVVDMAGQTHQVAYDLRGRVIQTTSPGWQVNMGYDQEDQVTSHTTATEGTVYIGRDALGRMTNTWGALGSSTSHDGLGHIVQVTGVSPGTQWETYEYDALGNRRFIHRVLYDPPIHDNGKRLVTIGLTGAVTQVRSEPAPPAPGDSLPPFVLDQRYEYDAAGNARAETSREWDAAANTNKFWSTRSYYGADEKLRVFNRFNGIGPTSLVNDRAHMPVYEVYWYDALGRRVLVWGRRDDIGCDAFWPECASAVTRSVWDGDQMLLEQRVTGPDTSTSWLEGGGQTVAYAHMGGIDAPVAAFRNDGVMVVPHANWRGSLVTGHAVFGSLPQIQWPGAYEALDGAPTVQKPYYQWFGDMLVGYTDGSGQKYMRNRYYDPVKGTFTQTDPIGLAGGVNLYGYADGDPVNYSDPFGLCPYEGGCRSPLFHTLRLFGMGEARAARWEAAGSAGGAITGAAGGAARSAGVAAGRAAVAGVPVGTVSYSRHPEAAAHIDDAQAAGQPGMVTLNRAGRTVRRGEALEGTPTRPGLDRDEYPPAMTVQGGRGASVRHINPSDNRGAGASLAAQFRTLPDNTVVRIKTEP